MIFIDGGYLRKLAIEVFGHDNINFNLLIGHLLDKYENCRANPFRANLIRVYYYDGIADPKVDAKAHEKQREYFEEIDRKFQNLSVSCGEAVKTGNSSFRQKGVDILLAIDALSMAYQGHYQSGLFLLGDRDFIPLIEAVKSAGIKTYGFPYCEKVAEELLVSFDFRFPLTNETIKSWEVMK